MLSLVSVAVITPSSTLTVQFSVRSSSGYSDSESLQISEISAVRLLKRPILPTCMPIKSLLWKAVKVMLLLPSSEVKVSS